MKHGGTSHGVAWLEQRRRQKTRLEREPGPGRILRGQVQAARGVEACMEPPVGTVTMWRAQDQGQGEPKGAREQI